MSDKTNARKGTDENSIRTAAADGDSDDVELEGPMPVDDLGTAELHVDVDRETYERVRSTYERAKTAGYSERFTTFAMNHLRTESFVTVDGRPADSTPDAGFERGVDR